MMQLLRHLLSEEGTDKVVLLYANRTVEEGAAVNEELFSLKRQFEEKDKGRQLQIVNIYEQTAGETVNPRKDEVLLTGRISKDVLARFLPSPKETRDLDEPSIFVCGPPPMMQAICGEAASPMRQTTPLAGYLRDLGYALKDVVRL